MGQRRLSRLLAVQVGTRYSELCALVRLAMQLTVLTRRNTCPAPKRAGEAGWICVAQFTRYVGDTDGLVFKELFRRIKANLVEQFVERHAVCCEPALQGAVAHAYQVRAIANGQAFIEVARQQ
jgi:hypothetical protein